MSALAERDPLDNGIVASARGLLAEFNAAGVLSPADVHVATTLGRLGAITDESVLLAAALAVHAPRLGNVRVDIASISDTATRELDDEGDLSELPWPEPSGWLARLAESALVGDECPLRLEGDALYLERYWTLERQVAADLQAHARLEAPSVDEGALESGLEKLFGDVWQRLAAATAVRRRLSIIAGGPGTGKTTTIARVIALLSQQAAAAGSPPPLIALAAPTGKAAARLAEAVHEEARHLDVDVSTRELMENLKGATIHRLLRSSPQNRTRFRHNRTNRLIHDAVIIDETSMVPLSLIARLIEAVRPDARLILAGDPDQLASVEAGAVLGDIVGPAKNETATGSATGSGVAAAIAVLRRTHRFTGILADLAAAIQSGNSARVIELLQHGDDALQWVDREGAAERTNDPVLRGATVRAGTAVVDAARAGDAKRALREMAEFRILCGHRHGPTGALTWGERVEDWLAAEIPGLLGRGAWYPGRPLLVTANDYSLNLFNGDTGVVVSSPTGRATAAFERGGTIEEVSPHRLASVESAHAMTIHKSQGSQFRTVAVILPGPESPILTRELLYTAVTRARERVVLVAAEASVRRAVERPVTRSSGLRELLWSR